MAETGFNWLELGQTLPGTDSAGNLINATALGTIKRFENRNLATQFKDFRSHGPIWAILLRNASSGTLLRRRLALLSKTAGYNLFEKVSGYGATLYDAPVVAVDPWLHATNGVADNDIFWGIFRGPTILMTPSSGSDILASATVGLPLICSDDNNGRITPAAPGDYATAYQASYSIFGRALYPFTNADTDVETAVMMACPWFPAG